MKEGWTYKKLGEVCETTSGGTPSKSHKEYYDGGKIPWLRSGEVSQGLIYDTELCITELGLEKSSAKIFPIDTVVIAMYGATVGQVGLLKREMSTNQAICGIFPNKIITPMFLLYNLKSKKTLFLKDAVGGAQPNISQNIIKNTIIPVPPLSEQQRVVNELDLLSSIIEKKKAQLKEYDQLAQSIFYDMFGNPVANEKGWEVKKLKQISNKITNGNTPKGGSEVYVDKGIMFFRSQNVWRNHISLDDIAYIDEETHKKLHNSSLCHNDILITKTGRFNTENSSLGRASIYEGKDNMANINGHVYLVRLKPFYLPLFVLYILISNSFKELIRSVCVGGIDKRQLNKNHIEDFPIILPPLTLQQSFASKIEAIERQKALIQQSITEAETLFNSRMNFWFS